MASPGEPIRIRRRDLGDLAGAWDPETNIIWLHGGLTQVEQRSTLAHELVHALRRDERPHNPLLGMRQERLVERIAARALIPIDRLADAMLWCRDDAELADELQVDGAFLATRWACLTAGEVAVVRTRLASVEQVA